MRHALAPLAVGVLLLSGGLACSGMGAEDEEAPSVQVETPALSGRAAHPHLVGLSGSPWPVGELSNHPLLVVDQDSATAWEASAGDLAVFFTPSLEGVTGARSMGSPAELRLLVKPARGSTHYDVTPWTALPGDGSRMADTPPSLDRDR